MTHVSRYKLTPKQEIQLNEKLMYVLTHIQSYTDMSNFLNALFTKTEKLMLAKRLAIIVLLEEGVSESQIASSLHVTRITVAKMNYFYQSQGQFLKLGIQKLKEKQMYDSFKSFLISLSKYSVKAAGGRI